MRTQARRPRKAAKGSKGRGAKVGDRMPTVATAAKSRRDWVSWLPGAAQLVRALAMLVQAIGHVWHP